MDRGVLTGLIQTTEDRGGGFLLLIDPDKTSPREYLNLAEAAEDCGVDAILIGTSFMLSTGFGEAVKSIKAASSLPTIIFPGSYAQLTPEADAVLFTTLISGRNPEYLIGEQVRGAPLVMRFGLEAIPTGYMLIESGNKTSVQFISGTMPIPRGKNDIACAHAMAAQCLGLKLCYLEAGSGAAEAVPEAMVAAVAACVDIPLLVGGGLRTPEDCAVRIEAGASFVVVGNLMEELPGIGYLRELTAATHTKETVPV